MTNTTLKLLAQQLQLSISTVSRALKDHPDISAATKAKVHALANSLDYEPNAYAIQLRTQSSKIFGVIVPAISNLFYDSFIAAVEEESRKNGYALMILQSSNKAENELDNLKIFRCLLVLPFLQVTILVVEVLRKVVLLLLMVIPIALEVVYLVSMLL